MSTYMLTIVIGVVAVLVAGWVASLLFINLQKDICEFCRHRKGTDYRSFRGYQKWTCPDCSQYLDTIEGRNQK